MRYVRWTGRGVAWVHLGLQRAATNRRNSTAAGLGRPRTRPPSSMAERKALNQNGQTWMLPLTFQVFPDPVAGARRHTNETSTSANPLLWLSLPFPITFPSNLSKRQTAARLGTALFVWDIAQT